MQPGDDAARGAQPAVEIEGVADGDDVVTDLDLVRVPELDRGQVRPVDLEHG